ncbi:MAG: DNA repair protein RecO [Armatimonadota bacterium]
MTLVARAFRGTGRMVSFYTRERGLVEAAARGIGKPGSSLAPAVELFTLSRLFLAEGKGADRLTQADVIEPFYELRRDTTRYAYAAVACELILRTTEPGQVIAGLFDTLVDYLRAMQGTSHPRLLSWAFELSYLEMSGLAPVLDRCARCEQPIVGGVYMPAHGGLLCRDCAPEAGEGLYISPGSARALAAMRSFDLDRLDRLRLPEPTAAEIAALLRDHVRYHLDVSLKAEGFVESLGRWRRPPAGPRAGDDQPRRGDAHDQ